MNAGVRASRGSLLVFVPADSVLPADATGLLARIDRDGWPLAGGFRHRFDDSRSFLRLISALHNARARLTGVFYGDQAPFVRRSLFLALGGFREDGPMEDVDLGTRLRRRTRPRQLALAVVTSARRFDRHGDFRAVSEAVRLLFCHSVLRRVPRSRIFFDQTEPRGGS